MRDSSIVEKIKELTDKKNYFFEVKKLVELRGKQYYAAEKICRRDE